MIPFARPDITDAEIEKVVEVLRSGILTNGPLVVEFEKSFADFLGAKNAVAVSSCTSGLQLALHGIGIKPGDEVITSSLTFTATIEAIAALGAKPVIVDIDPNTLNFDLNLVEEAISDRTHAVIPVHFGGLACDMYKLLELSTHYGFYIVEDAAHAFGSTWDGTSIGSFDFATTVFSFYPNKPITTAEGGMIVTSDPLLAKSCRSSRLHGIWRSVNSPAWDYKVGSWGMKANMNEMSAALGLVQLQRSGYFLQERSRISCLYNEAFADLPVHKPPVCEIIDTHSWHLYVLQLQADDREACHKYRAKVLHSLQELGIGTSVHYLPIFLHPYWQKMYGWEMKKFPHALKYSGSAFSLPIYSAMNDDQIQSVIDGVIQSVGKI